MDVVAPANLTSRQRKEWFEHQLRIELPKWQATWQPILTLKYFDEQCGEIMHTLMNGISINEEQMLSDLISCEGLADGESERM